MPDIFDRYPLDNPPTFRQWKKENPNASLTEYDESYRFGYPKDWPEPGIEHHNEDVADLILALMTVETNFDRHPKASEWENDAWRKRGGTMGVSEMLLEHPAPDAPIRAVLLQAVDMVDDPLLPPALCELLGIDYDALHISIRRIYDGVVPGLSTTRERDRVTLAEASDEALAMLNSLIETISAGRGPKTLRWRPSKLRLGKLTEVLSLLREQVEAAVAGDRGRIQEIRKQAEQSML